MRAIMGDLLTGWSANGKRPGVLNNTGNSSSFCSRQEINSSGSNTATSAGITLGRARSYGWSPSRTPSGGSREVGVDNVDSRRGETVRRHHMEKRILQLYSPYFIPVRQRVVLKRPGSRRPGTATKGSLGRLCNGSAVASRRSPAGVRRQPSPSPSPFARGLRKGGGAASRPVSPPYKASARASRSPGGAFFEKLFRVSHSCGGKGAVLLNLRPASGNGIINSACDYNARDCNVHGDDTTPDPLLSETRPSSFSSCNPERSSENLVVNKAVFRRYLMEWEDACVMEASASERRLVESNKVRQLRKQIDEANSALAAIRVRQFSLREQVRSYTALQLEVNRQERKSRELQRLAQLARKRINGVESLEEKKGVLFGAGTLRCGGMDRPFSLVNLTHEKSLLQRERAALKEAIRAASVESAEKSLRSTRNFRVLLLVRDAERRRLESHIAILKARERQLRMRVKRSVLRAKSIVKRVEELQATMAEPDALACCDDLEFSESSFLLQTPRDGNDADKPIGGCFLTECFV
ncbi:hypothetical protein MOQ_003426 [Trypanosoma cruzi marinkellei]|uniref:Uncharacterized protein n=1 Tax=Trypanosoma cruzi marinkellei TaxID=85056 RepID=K2N066_TRYCR|nr:hypothetical protein MOQ_003426 [Trypanosoma cruzi marinkellei]